MSTIAVVRPTARTPRIRPASTCATSLAITSRTRSGATISVGVIVPWRNSVVTARMPRISAKTCANPAIPSRSTVRTSSFSKSAVMEAISPISTTRPTTEAIRARAVRVLRSLSSSEEIRRVIRPSPGRP